MFPLRVYSGRIKATKDNAAKKIKNTPIMDLTVSPFTLSFNDFFLPRGIVHIITFMFWCNKMRWGYCGGWGMWRHRGMKAWRR